MRKFTQIKGLSQERRLPRLGRIRLGIKKRNSQGVEYPSETSYFVVPPEVASVYGDQPVELDVMLPVEDTSISFPQNLAFYGSSRGLKCSGDGERAMRTIAFEKDMHGEDSEVIPVDRRGKATKDDLGDLIEVPCTCELEESGKCKRAGYLQLILPKVSVGGVYQITTSSFNSIIDLNSGIDYVRVLVGRVAMVPLKLKRVPTETHHDGKKQTHYTMRIIFEGDINTLNFLRENTHKVLEGPRLSLPTPEMENPAMDAADVVDVEPEQPKESVPAEETAVPEINSKSLISRLENCKTVDDVNELLDLNRAQSDENAKREFNREAAKKIKEITSRKA